MSEMLWVLGFIFLFLSIAVSQSDVLTFTHVPNPMTIGEPQAITYSTNDITSPITIIVKKGTLGNLDTIQTLTTDATGGQYIWTPGNNLTNGNDYALEIEQGNQVNYFGPFTLQGQIVGGSQSGSSSTHSSSSSPPPSTSSITPTSGLKSSSLTKTSTRSSAAPLSTQSETAKSASAPKSGLSTGAAIGIGIAIAAVVVIVAALGFVYYRRRSRVKNSAPPTGGMATSHHEKNAAEGVSRSETRHEKDGTTFIGELITKANTHELHENVKNSSHELPGN